MFRTFAFAVLAAACASCGGGLSPGSPTVTPAIAGSPVSAPLTASSAGTPAPSVQSVGVVPAPTAWTPTLKVQAVQPLGVVFAFGSIWVSEHHSGNLLRVDPSTGRVTATIAGIGDEAQVPFQAGGRVWVPSPAGIVGVDPRTNRIGASVTGTYSGSGAVAAASAWIGDGSDDLLRLDMTTGETVATLAAHEAKPRPEDCGNTVATDTTALWWSVNDAGIIERVDATSGRLAGEADSVGASVVAASPNAVWATSNDGVLRKLEPATGLVTAAFALHGPATDNCAGSIAVDGDTVWIEDDRSFNDLYRFDAATAKVTGYFDPGDFDIQTIALADHALWATFYDSGVVARFDQPRG